MGTWLTSTSSRTIGAGGSSPTRPSATPACIHSMPICSASGWPTPSEREAERTMLRTTRLFGTAAFGILLGVIGCNNENLFTPANYLTRDPLFDRYVSLLNSITAGFQSGRINDSTQHQSYAVLLSRHMAPPIFVPLLNQPGCPPPIS